jgi:hypothetical protein
MRSVDAIGARGIVPPAVCGILVLLVMAGGVMAAVAPSLPTADAIFAIVIAVAVLGFVIWLMFLGASGWSGGWPWRKDRMG